MGLDEVLVQNIYCDLIFIQTTGVWHSVSSGPEIICQIRFVEFNEICGGTYVRINWRLIFGNVIRSSRLRLWVGYFICFKFTPMFFYSMFLIDVLQFNVKYLLKSYYWEKQTFSKLRFSKFKKCVFRSVFGEFQLTQVSLNFWNFLLQFKNQRSGSKTVCGFSVILILKGIMTF